MIGSADTIDPLGGSYYIEKLTDESKKAIEYIDKSTSWAGRWWRSKKDSPAGDPGCRPTVPERDRSRRPGDRGVNVSRLKRAPHKDC